MSKTVDQAKEEVAELCRYFATNRQAFLAPGVKEAHVRQSLIDPLFEALGWDVRNTARTAPQYREVIPEDSLDVEGHQKAPDYTFRVGALPKFFAEAKKCGVNVSADPAPAYQLRRYGWSAKVALSVLTDFEELGVYDCTTRPRPNRQATPPWEVEASLPAVLAMSPDGFATLTGLGTSGASLASARSLRFVSTEEASGSVGSAGLTARHSTLAVWSGPREKRCDPTDRPPA